MSDSRMPAGRATEGARSKRTTAAAEPVVNLTALRAHWSSVVLATCMRHAALLKLVEWGESDLRKLPDSVYQFAFRKCAEIRDEVMAEELKLGARPSRLEQRVNADLWDALKPFRAADALVPRGTEHDSTQQFAFEEPS